MKKIIALIIAAICICSLFALTACGGGGNEGGKDNDAVKTYIFEAEYVDLEDVQGGGLSSSEQGLDVIYGHGTQEEKDLGWSNGYYLGMTSNSNFEITFEFTSDKAGTANFILRLGSEIGNIDMNKNGVALYLNGVEIDYLQISIATSEDLTRMRFYDKTIVSGANIKEGVNTFTLDILDNTYMSGGSTGGPTIDCLKIETSCALTLNEFRDNPANKGKY